MKSIQSLPTHTQGEAVSLLMDNALDSDAERHQVLQHLTDNPSSQHYWQRYHLIGDVMRQDFSLPLQSQLLHRIHLTLAHDPPLSPPRTIPLVKRLFSPLASLALAASVAAVAIVGLQQLTLEPQNDTPPLLSSQTRPTQSPYTVPVADNKWDVPQSAVAQALDRYWLNHNESIVAPTYTQTVRYDSTR